MDNACHRKRGRPGPAIPIREADMRFALRPLAVLFALFIVPFPAFAQPSALDGTFGAVMRLKTFVPAEARTAATLGREREGTAILIDATGLLLTIGYLMVEASGGEVRFPDGRTVLAQVVGYDHDTGLGLMRAAEAPRGVKPLALGRSSDVKARDPVVIAAHGGAEAAAPAFVVSRRTFAGNWEYMLDQAIWTSPPHPAWSGAALLDTDGKLVGVGSLIVNNASDGETPIPGNVFVPIDMLAPILADLIDDGKSSGPRAAVAGHDGRGGARPAVRRARDAGRAGGKGRHQARRRGRFGQGHATGHARRAVPCALGAGAGRNDAGVRPAAGRRREEDGRAVRRPAHAPQAQVVALESRLSRG
jgi:S1-C subfamily serine protease